MEYEKALSKALVDAWEKEWKKEKSSRVAKIHNRLVVILAEEQAHIDELIVAVELLRLEALETKLRMIREEAKSPQPNLSDETPSVIS